MRVEKGTAAATTGGGQGRESILIDGRREGGCYPWRSAFKKAVNVAATGGSGGGSSPAPPLAPAPVLPMAVAVSAIVVFVAVAVASSATG